MKKFDGGYIIVSRKIVESEVFKKPPMYLKVWIYLLTTAQHTDYKRLQRGELWTSIPDIQEACSHYVGYRKMTPSKDEIYRIIDWLRKSYEGNDERDTKAITKEPMIATTKATQGMLIKVLNYSVYQDPKSYESNSEDNDEDNDEKATKMTRSSFDRNNINKNVKNDKKDKKDKKEIEGHASSRFVPPSLSEVKEYCKEKSLSVNPEKFIDYYMSIGWKVGNSPMKDWKATLRNWNRRERSTKNETSKSVNEYTDLDEQFTI